MFWGRSSRGRERDQWRSLFSLVREISTPSTFLSNPLFRLLDSTPHSSMNLSLSLFIRLSIHPSPPLSLPTRPDHSLAHVFGLRYHVSCRSRSIARTVFHVYNGTFVILVNQPSADLGQILAQAVYKGCPKIYAGFELNIKESLWIFIFYA